MSARTLPLTLDDRNQLAPALRRKRLVAIIVGALTAAGFILVFEGFRRADDDALWLGGGYLLFFGALAFFTIRDALRLRADLDRSRKVVLTDAVLERKIERSNFPAGTRYYFEISHPSMPEPFEIRVERDGFQDFEEGDGLEVELVPNSAIPLSVNITPV